MSTYTAKVGEIVMIDPAAGVPSWTVLAPPSPLENNDRFTILSRTEELDLVTVDFNGNTLEGAISSLQAAMPSMVTEFVWSEPTSTWHLINAIPAKPAVLQLDGRAWNPGSLDGTWQTVTGYAEQVNQFCASTTDSFTLYIPGIYRFSISLGFQHNSSNSGRTTNLRIYNVTDAVEVDSFVMSTGRNAEGTNWSISLIVDFPLSSVGAAFEIQIGNGDVYSLVTIDMLEVSLNAVDTSLIAQAEPPPPPYQQLLAEAFANYNFANDDGSDTTPNARDLTSVGTPTYAAHGLANVPGQAVGSLSAANKFTAPQDIMTGLTAWTVCSWLKTADVTTDQASPWLGASSTWSLPMIRYRIADGGYYEVRARAGDNTLIIDDMRSNIPIPAGVWFHVAITYDGTTAKIYMDGVDVTTGGTVTAGQTLGSDANIPGISGAKNVNAQRYSGEVADMFIFNRALSATEIGHLIAGDV